RAALHGGAARRIEAHLDRAGLRRVTAQVAQALQRRQVGVDRGRRAETHALTDLAHRRRVAPLPHRGVDAVEDLPLAGGEVVFGHWEPPGGCTPMSDGWFIPEPSTAHVFGQ